MPARPFRAAAPQGPRILRPIRPAKLQQMAAKQAAAQLQAAQAPITSARAAAAQQALARGQQIQGADAAMVKMLPPASDVQHSYQDAAQETAGLAGAFTGAAGQQLTAAEKANADFLQQQAPGATPQNEPNVQAGQDSAYYLGGYNPGASLEAQGAAAYQTAAGQADVQNAVGRQDILSNDANAQKNDQQYVQAMLDLAAKQPDMQNQILDHLYQREFQKIQLGISEQAQNLYQQKFGEQRFVDRQNLKQSNTRLWLQGQGLKLQIAKQNSYLQQQIKDGRRIDASASRVAGHLIDKSGNPILDKGGKPIPIAPSGGGKTNQGVNSTGYKEAVRATKGLMPQPKEIPSNNPQSGQYKYWAKPGVGTPIKDAQGRVWSWVTNDPNQAAVTGQYTFPEAVGYVMNAYGINRAAARRALIAGGWKPNGKRPPKKPTGT